MILLCSWSPTPAWASSFASLPLHFSLCKKEHSFPLKSAIQKRVLSKDISPISAWYDKIMSVPKPQ